MTAIMGGGRKTTKYVASNLQKKVNRMEVGRIHNIKILLDSVLCICAEGVEFMSRTEMSQKISSEVVLAMRICDELIEKATKKGGVRWENTKTT